MIVALALSPSLDVTYEVDELRRGEITRPTTVTRVAGGKALNVVRVAHALGAPVQAVAALGGHSGAWVAELLAADGVPADIITLAAETRVSSAIVETGDATSSTDLYEPATPLRAAEWTAFSGAAVTAAGDRGAWVAISGSLPAGVGADDVAGLLHALRDSGARVAVDSSGGGLRAMAPAADLIKVNRSEAEALLGEIHPDAASAARSLHERYGCDAVVTDGVRGGAAVFDSHEYEVPRPGALGRYPAGSGDAFLGGLLTGLDRGDAASDALDLARDAAERNARVAGQGILEP
ncbi:hypothetical protein ASD56_02050 [Microbacterium sp. Root166]|nr:hypothetical protein ASD56_02050 [Microbacterium sp. Root166]